MTKATLFLYITAIVFYLFLSTVALENFKVNHGIVDPEEREFKMQTKPFSFRHSSKLSESAKTKFLNDQLAGKFTKRHSEGEEDLDVTVTTKLATLCGSNTTDFLVCDNQISDIFTGNHGESSHAIVYNPQRDEFFLVIVEEEETGETNLLGLRLKGSDGSVITTQTLFANSDFNALKQTPEVVYDSVAQQYLVVFGYGESSVEDFSLELGIAWVTELGVVVNYTFVQDSSRSFLGEIDVKFNPQRNVYAFVFSAYNSAFRDIVFMLADTNAVIDYTVFYSGLVESNPNLAINANGTAYYIIMQIINNGFADLFLVRLDSQSFNITNENEIYFEIETSAGALEVTEKRPQLTYIPNINQFLLVCEGEVDVVSLNELFAIYIDEEASVSSNLNLVTNYVDGIIHQYPLVASLSPQSSKVVVVFEEVNQEQNSVGYSILNLSDLSQLQQVIIPTDNADQKDYHISVAVNPTNGKPSLIFNRDVLAETAAANKKLSSGAVAGIVIGVILGVLLIVVLFVLFLFFIRPRLSRSNSKANRLEEESQEL